MRTVSVSALKFGAMFLIVFAMTMFTSCVDTPICDDVVDGGDDDDDSVVVDETPEECVADDDDDSTTDELADVTITIGDLQKFLGYDGPGTSTEGVSLGVEVIEEFEIMVGEHSGVIYLNEGDILAGHEIVFPGDGTEVHFKAMAMTDDIVHANCYGKVVADGKVVITIMHSPQYLEMFPEFGTVDTVDGVVDYAVNDGDEITLPVNYNADGFWQCWFNQTPYDNSIGNQNGEQFGTWFINSQLFANGHFLMGAAGDSEYEMTISSTGQSGTGRVYAGSGFNNLECAR